MSVLALDSPTAPTQATTTQASLAEVAQALVPALAARAEQADAADAFVADSYAELRAAGLLEAGVPAELGGGGASLPELCDMLRVLAHGCGSTALAFAMHTHQVAVPAWRWRHQPQARAAVEPILRRVATERIVLLSSGGSDWIGGSGTAERVEGGWRVTARKAFTSGSPAGDLLMTGAVAEEDGESIVVHFAAPMAAPEVRVLDTWHALGMRGTGSHEVRIDGLLVPDAKVSFKRKAGQWHPVFQIIATIAFPLIYSVYLGVAESARDLAVDLAKRRPSSPRTRSMAGRLDTTLAATRLAHRSMVEAAERNAPGADSVNDVMIGRRLVEEGAIGTVEFAMELAGGVGFHRAAGLERRFRDVQAARYHPLQKDAQAEYAGAMALGEPMDRIW
jgi:alkylation response protein AidB-like acyl-CoA dehydrogenase